MRKRVVSWLLVILFLFQNVGTPVYAAGSNWENSKSNSSEVAVESTYAEEIDVTEMLDTSIAEETETYVEESAIESEEESGEEEMEVTTSEEESIVIETEAEETSEASETEETTTENEEDNSISSVESDIAEITNIQVETIGYQQAKVVFDVTCTEGMRVGYYGGYECSEGTLSDSDVYISKYYDLSGNRVDDRYYMLVKVQPEVKLSYNFSVGILNENDERTTISSDETVSITGLSFDMMKPEVTVTPGIEKAYFNIKIDNYIYDVNGSFKIEVYNRKYGETEWSDWFSGSKEFLEDNSIVVEYQHLDENTRYEFYFKFVDKNGTDATAQTDIIEFTTEKDVVYSREEFPDDGFYEVITGLISSEEITQSALDDIINVRVTKFEDGTYGNSVPVRSIEGIQYCRNVKYINLAGQEIEDVSLISNLTRLEKIDFNSNNLKTIPDMSNLRYLGQLDLDYNMIPVSEFVDSKLPENYDWYTNWNRSKEYQRTGSEEIVTVPVCYGWGTSYPVAFGIRNSKWNIYTIKLTVGEQQYEKIIQYGGTKTGIAEAKTIPNTQLTPGQYQNAKLELYDAFNNKVTEKTFDFEMREDETTFRLKNISFEKGDTIFATVEIPNVEKIISKGEILQNDIVFASATASDYGISSYLYGNYSWDYNERYYDIFGEHILSEEYECERRWVEGLVTFNIQENILPGDYDIRFTLEDGTTIVLENEFAVNDTPIVFAAESARSYEDYKYKYNNTEDYIYIVIEAYNMDEEKVYPELYVGDNLVTQSMGVVEKADRMNGVRTDYVYKLKKIDVEKYWKQDGNYSQTFKWKLNIDSDYLVRDMVDVHDISVWYNDLDTALIWVDDAATENSMHIYFNSKVEDNTKVSLEVEIDDWEHDGYEFVGRGEGIVKDQVLKLNLYDADNNIHYIECGTNAYCFNYSFLCEGSNDRTVSIEGVTAYSGPGAYSQNPYSSIDGILCTWLYVPKASNITTFKGFQLGDKMLPSVVVDLYLPGVSEKVKSITATLGSKNEYYFTSDDISSLRSDQPYQICIRDNSGKRIVGSRIGYLTTESNSSTTVPPTKITLNKAELSLGIGETETLKATISPSNATNKTVSWTSTDTSVATVDSSGKVAAVASGSAFIVARTHNGLNAACKVTVYDSKGEVITIKPGEDYKIQIPDYVNAKKVKFTSEDTSIAKVTNAGLVSGVSLGTTKITLTSGNVKIDYQVTVTNPLQSIRFEEEKITLEVNENTTNSVIFTPVLTDNDKAISVTVGDNAIASATVVGRTIRINALAQGNTTVTATVGDLQATCEVTIIAKVSVPDLTGNNVYAFLNRDKTLGELDNQLPNGFDFVEPDLVLSKFAGVNEKEFAVTYTDENGRTAESVQTVKFVSATGINMMVDKTTLEVSEEDFSQVNMSVEWSGYNAPSEIKEDFLQNYEYELSANKEGIVSIEGTGANYKIKGLKKGNVTLTAVLREKGSIGKDGIILKATANVKVTEEIAKITIGVEGASYNEEKDYYVVNDVTNAAVILEASAEGYTVKWSTSDSSVVKVGTTKDNKTPVTVKSNGKVKLTATANDAAKTSKSIMLYIIDTKPSIDGDVTINKALANGGTMGIYASYGYEIAQYDVQIMKVDNPDESDTRFLIDYNKDKDIYEVCLADADGVKEGKYTVVVKVTADTETGKEAYFENVTISVINKAVTYSIKQNIKVNLFYNDEQGNGALSINGKNAVIESVVLEDCDFGYELETGAISFIGDNFENPDKEGTLIITFEGYVPVSKTIKINTENKKPKLKTSAASSVLYPNAGITIAKMQITDSTAGVALYVENANMNQENLETDEYRAYAQDGEVCYVLKESVKDYPKSKKITFKLQMDNWNDEIAVSHTIKSNAATNPEVSLSSKTITLNKNDLLAKYQSGDVIVKVKNATENVVDAIAVSGADKKSITAMNTGMDFAFDDETGKLEVWFNDSRNVNAGTYNYNILAKVADGKLAKTKIKVKVVDKTPASTITVKTKGSIDIIDRKNTAVLCNAKFSNVSGKVVNVRLAGQDAHLFNVTLNESGEVKITAREDVAYITKYGYKLQLVYTLESSDRTYDVVSKAFLIKVKQGKTTVNAKMDSAQLYQAADNAINLNLTAINKIGTELEIREVAIVEAKATKNAFKLTYDDTAKCYKLCVNDVSKLKKNKNYTIKLNVWTKNQADNERPTTVSIKVKVK